jgi:hypothetical protein
VGSQHFAWSESTAALLHTNPRPMEQLLKQQPMGHCVSENTLPSIFQGGYDLADFGEGVA